MWKISAQHKREGSGEAGGRSTLLFRLCNWLLWASKPTMIFKTRYAREDLADKSQPLVELCIDLIHENRSSLFGWLIIQMQEHCKKYRQRRQKQQQSRSWPKAGRQAKMMGLELASISRLQICASPPRHISRPCSSHIPFLLLLHTNTHRIVAALNAASDDWMGAGYKYAAAIWMRHCLWGRYCRMTVKSCWGYTLSMIYGRSCCRSERKLLLFMRARVSQPAIEAAKRDTNLLWTMWISIETSCNRAIFRCVLVGCQTSLARLDARTRQRARAR